MDDLEVGFECTSLHSDSCVVESKLGGLFFALGGVAEAARREEKGGGCSLQLMQH